MKKLQDQDKEWSAFYADYVKAFIERDVRELAVVQNLNAFRQFMIAVAGLVCIIINIRFNVFLCCRLEVKGNKDDI